MNDTITTHVETCLCGHDKSSHHKWQGADYVTSACRHARGYWIDGNKTHVYVLHGSHGMCLALNCECIRYIQCD